MARWVMPLASLADTPEGLNASAVIARGADVHNGSFSPDQVGSAGFEPPHMQTAWKTPLVRGDSWRQPHQSCMVPCSAAVCLS